MYSFSLPSKKIGERDVYVVAELIVFLTLSDVPGMSGTYADWLSY